jgi:spore coat polysaccharide biosynthesis protein SpsF (cytidylyltransferase family)
LLGEACRTARTGDWDFVTNLYPRSFPYGVSVELIRTQTYEMMYGRMSDSEDFEHVTRALYRHMADFRYFNIERKGDDLSGVRLTVDTETDLVMVERLLEVCGKRLAHLSYLDAVQVYEKLRSN